MIFRAWSCDLDQTVEDATIVSERGCVAAAIRWASDYDSRQIYRMANKRGSIHVSLKAVDSGAEYRILVNGFMSPEYSGEMIEGPK